MGVQLNEEYLFQDWNQDNKKNEDNIFSEENPAKKETKSKSNYYFS